MRIISFESVMVNQYFTIICNKVLKIIYFIICFFLFRLSAEVIEYMYYHNEGFSTTQSIVFCLMIQLQKRFCYCLIDVDETALDASRCPSPCPGDRMDSCGSDQAMSVYKTRRILEFWAPITQFSRSIHEFVYLSNNFF